MISIRLLESFCKALTRLGNVNSLIRGVRLLECPLFGEFTVFVKSAVLDILRHVYQSTLLFLYSCFFYRFTSTLIQIANTLWRKSSVKKAMAAWSDETCVKFVPRTEEKDYVEFFADFGK